MLLAAVDDAMLTDSIKSLKANQQSEDFDFTKQQEAVSDVTD